MFLPIGMELLIKDALSDCVISCRGVLMKNMILKISALLVGIVALINCKGPLSSTVSSNGSGKFCSDSKSDPDGDGWGYEYGESCKVARICSASVTDTDGDGWGYENGESCKMTRFCSSSVSDNDGDGWGYEYNQSCKISPNCGDSSSDPDGDGWGYENGRSCRTGAGNSPKNEGGSGGGSVQLYETTYYPYHGEHYFRTVCGNGDDHGGMYFAVTERSPLWSGSCNNENWVPCQDSDCLGKFDRMPSDVKKWDNGQRMVREPSCDIPCGRRFKISSADNKIQTTAVIYDACPSQHWNNRFKEATEGRNPCAAGALHVDLRKPLYIHLNGGQVTDNIKVLIDSNPVQ